VVPQGSAAPAEAAGGRAGPPAPTPFMLKRRIQPGTRHIQPGRRRILPGTVPAPPVFPTEMTQCITCGAELHPERARKYDYCMAPECQERNARGLNLVAVGMNKAAEEILILDDGTRQDLASGRYHDQRRGLFGAPAYQPPRASDRRSTQPLRRAADRAAQPQRVAGRRARPPQRSAARPPWTRSQEKLALIYNEQGLRPAEIASKLGVSAYLVTQIILSAKNRGKV
jgi:hypothetical protein